MKICVFGAGAGGGHFAVKLAKAGHDVSVIARGQHLQAIQDRGLTLQEGGESTTLRLTATDNTGTLGVQDLVIVATKATALAGLASSLPAVVGQQSAVLFPQNGMTWWYNVERPAGTPPPPPLRLFGLADTFRSVLRADQILGGIIYSANAVDAPGVVRNTSPGRNRLDVGAITSNGEAAARRIRAVLESAGLASPPVADMRRAVWGKLLTNMSGSAIAVATENPSAVSRRDPALGEVFLGIVREGLAIAAAHGYALDLQPDAMQAALLDHKPSLLQDYQQNRPMEVAEILLAPLAFARSQQVPAPHLQTVAAIISRRAQDRGLFAPETDP